MFCERCHKRAATMRLTRVISNKKFEISLCEECARETGQVAMQPFNGIGSMLSGLLSFSSIPPAVYSLQKVKVCTGCGMTLDQVYSSGRLGCDECYTSFAEYLRPLLKKIHGNSQHIGRQQVLSELESNHDNVENIDDILQGFKNDDVNKCSDEIDKLNMLKDQMKNAIASEDFEKAAELRDTIKLFEMKEGESNV